MSVVILLVGVISGAAVHQASAAPVPQSTPTTWTVLVGGETQGSAWQFMRFYPNTITVNVGDTIVWKLNSAEPHTVTFPKAGDKAPDLIIPEGEGSQRVVFNPLVLCWVQWRQFALCSGMC